MNSKVKKPIIIIQGAQWGSEAKGAIAGYICETETVNYAVRTGATNAGHTVYYQGVPYKMQQLPVGWIVPDVQLVLGAGSVIDPVILERECRMVSDATGQDIKKRLVIDSRAALHLPVHQERSAKSGRHHKMGATGKGCSEAIIDRIRGRGEGARNFGDVYSNEYNVDDTAYLLNVVHNTGNVIMLEGTQGTLLDLCLGPYPYVTHKQTGPAQWMMEAGLSPALQTDVVSVVRTYPIRVAGNSGPMLMETSWPTLARAINEVRARHQMEPLVSEFSLALFEQAVISVATRNPGAVPRGSNGLDMHQWSSAQRVEFKEFLSEGHKMALEMLDDVVLTDLAQLFELTTVTKKLRRIAHMSLPTLGYSTMLDRPHRVALTFMNYVFPQHWYVDGQDVEFHSKIGEYIAQVEAFTNGAPVTMASFGPESRHVAIVS